MTKTLKKANVETVEYINYFIMPYTLKNFIIDSNTGKLKHEDLSRNLKGKALIEYKKTLILNNIQKQVLIGTLLGDASMAIKQGKPAYYIKFEQKLASAAYINHLYQMFKPFVGTPPHVRAIDPNGVYAKPRFSVAFRTYQHDYFKYYYDLFYPQVLEAGKKFINASIVSKSFNPRKKRVPHNIAKLLTPRALAYWFMDDGNCAFSTSKMNTSNYSISTHSFSYDDQVLLVNALKNNFDISAIIPKDKQYYRLYIVSKSTQKFVNLIKPFIHKVFMYKIDQTIKWKSIKLK